MKPNALKRNSCLPLLMILSIGNVVAADQQTARDTQAQPYTYNDDWAVVSAPPPQGPYNAINLDPRLPGQDLVAPMPMPDDVTTPELPAASTLPPPPVAKGAAVPAQSAPASHPPQTPYDYGARTLPGDKRPSSLAMPAPQATAPEPGPAGVGGYLPAQAGQGPVGYRGQSWPEGSQETRGQPVAPAQQMARQPHPVPGHYRSQDYSQSATRPMYGYPWSSRQTYSGYPASAYPRSPWQGGGPRTSEIEVPPPSVYNRMMAEPPPTRYTSPPGRVDYYGGGR